MMLSTRPTVASPPKPLAPTDVVTRASRPSARSRATSRSRTASLAGLPSGRGRPAIAVTVSIARAALKVSAGASAGSGAGGRRVSNVTAPTTTRSSRAVTTPPREAGTASGGSVSTAPSWQCAPRGVVVRRDDIREPYTAPGPASSERRSVGATGAGSGGGGGGGGGGGDSTGAGRGQLVRAQPLPGHRRDHRVLTHRWRPRPAAAGGGAARWVQASHWPRSGVVRLAASTMAPHSAL